LWTNLFGNRDGKPPRATAGIQHFHSGLQIQITYNDTGSIGLSKWVIEFDEPAQPDRAGKFLAMGCQPPNQSNHESSNDQAQTKE
jgi:hypothetical protein